MQPLAHVGPLAFGLGAVSDAPRWTLERSCATRVSGLPPIHPPRRHDTVLRDSHHGHHTPSHRAVSQAQLAGARIGRVRAETVHKGRKCVHGMETASCSCGRRGRGKQVAHRHEHYHIAHHT